MKAITGIWFVIVAVFFAGWVQCVVKFIQCDFEPSYKAEVIYGVGIATPVGGVVGWMDFGE